MEAKASTDDVSAENRAEMLKTVLQAQADEYGEVEGGARVKITVSYENRKGNVSIKHGEVWRATDDKINFSENIGADNENPFYLRFDFRGVTVVSVSERGSETDLGQLSNIVIEG